MEKTGVVYIVSGVEKSLSFEWIALNLDESKFDLSFVLIGKPGTSLEQYLKARKVRVHAVDYTGKLDVPKAFFFIVTFFLKHRPQVVHTHLIDANIIGLTAAWIVGIKKRIFTRHHAMVHYDEYPQGVKWDKWCNMIATHIIATSKAIRDILIQQDKAKAHKVVVIPHGFNLTYFEGNTATPNTIRKKYQIQDNAFPVVGVISRYVEWKGIQFVIPAFCKLRNRWPGAHLILANAHGPFQHEIKRLLEALPASAFTEILFEEDLAGLYKALDIFVHVPIDKQSEAFGQTYVEALAAGVPSIFTYSGIANEFIQDFKNAIVVKHKSSEQIHNAMITLLENDFVRETIIRNGRLSVRNSFSLELMIERISQLYLS